MPESRPQESARWNVAAWSLRTKVAVVLVVPAVVALVLGGVRVQGQLDNANRLSAVRDQLAVLAESVTLSDLVAQELVAAVTPGDPGFPARRTATDEQVGTVRSAARFAGLPDTVRRDLDGAIGQLEPLRQQAAGAEHDSIAVTRGYREVMTTLADLVPGVVGFAGNENLDDRAGSVRSLLLLRATLTAEEALILSEARGAAAAAQDAAAEETVFGRQLVPELPVADRSDFESATATAQLRRDALLTAVATGDTTGLTSLLPGLRTAAAGLNALHENLFADLVDTVTSRTNDARSNALRDSAVVLAALLAALVVALTVARSLLSPLHRLRGAALTAAHRQLPETVERVRAGEQVDWRSVEPVPVHTEEEIGQVARAFDEMHQQAVRLAGEQAELRTQVSEMFMTLSRRSQSLVELQLNVIEELEADEQDPLRLAGLFRLDHLATRLRRNGENLQVLAGGTPPRRGSRPVPVVELLRAATSEITDYRRVALGNAPTGSVRAAAAADLVHILAELLENATRFSPPDRKVVLNADRGTHGGLLFEVVDGGLGMAEEDLAAANDRLSTTDAVGPETTRRMGLFVVSQLAARHGVTVRLRPTYDSSSQAGVTASIHVPDSLVVADKVPDRRPEPRPEPASQPALASVGAAFEPAAAPIPQPAPPPPTSPATSLPTLLPTPPPIPEVTNGRPISWFTPAVEADEPDPIPGWPPDSLPSRRVGAEHRAGRPGEQSTETSGDDAARQAAEDTAVPPAGNDLPPPVRRPAGNDTAPPADPAGNDLPPPVRRPAGNDTAPPIEPAGNDLPLPARRPADPAGDPVAGYRAADPDDPPVTAGTTAAGLPMRKPGGHALPDRPTERSAERTSAQRPVDFRDPETIRSNLSRHYSGMQAARRARHEADEHQTTNGSAPHGRT